MKQDSKLTLLNNNENHQGDKNRKGIQDPHYIPVLIIQEENTHYVQGKKE